MDSLNDGKVDDERTPIGCTRVNIIWGDGVNDSSGLVGLRYQTKIPKVSLGRLNVAITRVPTTMSGEGENKLMYLVIVTMVSL
jgi:hypothetical protein